MNLLGVFVWLAIVIGYAAAVLKLARAGRAPNADTAAPDSTTGIKKSVTVPHDVRSRPSARPRLVRSNRRPVTWRSTPCLSPRSALPRDALCTRHDRQ